VPTSKEREGREMRGRGKKGRGGNGREEEGWKVKGRGRRGMDVAPSNENFCLRPCHTLITR